jgi:hypothetical protein
MTARANPRHVDLIRAARLIVAASAAVLAVFVACSCANQPCHSGEAQCEGKNLRTCGQTCSDCDIEWLPATPCGGACITESSDRAFCSLTEDADPLCAGRTGYCDAEWQVHCRSGYPTVKDRCEPPAGVPGTAACIEVAGGLACKATGTLPPQDGGSDVRNDGTQR